MVEKISKFIDNDFEEVSVGKEIRVAGFRVQLTFVEPAVIDGREIVEDLEFATIEVAKEIIVGEGLELIEKLLEVEENHECMVERPEIGVSRPIMFLLVPGLEVFGHQIAIWDFFVLSALVFGGFFELFLHDFISD